MDTTKIDKENNDLFGDRMTDSRVHDSIIIMKHDNKRVYAARAVCVCECLSYLCLHSRAHSHTHNQTAKMMTMNFLFRNKVLQKSCRVIVTEQEFNERVLNSSVPPEGYRVWI